jgi:MFS family permease
MVGLERGVLPLVAGKDFGIVAGTSILSFIASFGLAKALTNLTAGALADRIGRRALLVAGWLLALPVPLIVLWAPSWAWIVAANALLGISQGLTWSLTVIMKIDLVGPKQRGLAMGFNESAGYVAVAVAAFASGVVATHYGLRAGPAYLGIAIAASGLLLSSLFVRDTTAHARLEQSTHGDAADKERLPAITTILRRSMWSDRGLFSVSQAGLINNLNDGLAWGVFPLFFAANGLSLARVSVLVAVYPAVWGVGQLFTGALSDRIGGKELVVWGMSLQGVALIALAFTHRYDLWLLQMVMLGAGTAMVYPSLLAAVSDFAQPSWRGRAVGVYRLWRDLGYVAGALLAGVLSDAIGFGSAIFIIGALTILSGIVARLRWPVHVHYNVNSYFA